MTKLLRVVTPEGQKGDIGRRNGVIAQGARLVSAIADGGNVFEFVSRATVRFLLIEGLDILGGGREGHGIGLAALNGCTLLSTVDSRTTMNRHPASTRVGPASICKASGH